MSDSWQEIETTSSELMPASDAGAESEPKRHADATASASDATETQLKRIKMACTGSKGCPWCSLGCDAEEHGVIEQPCEQFLVRLARCAEERMIDTGVEKWMQLSLRMQLIACAVDFQNNTSDNEESMQRRMQRVRDATGALPPDLSPKTLQAVERLMNGLAAEEPDQASGGGGRNRGKKNRSAATHSWDDPEDAEWRHEAWVVNDWQRARSIRVWGGEATKWITLPDTPTQDLLRWYDNGKRLDILKGVKADPDNHMYYDYRIEGGKFLTQNNPNRQGPVRECRIIYVGQDP